MRSLLPASARSCCVAILVLCCCCAEEAKPGEPAAAPPGGCSSDAECGEGRLCEAAACVDEPAATAACSFEADPRCDEGTLCLPSADPLCPGSEGCVAPGGCVAVVGELDGAFACSADAECRSGRCHEGVCLRLCRDAADCDGTACVELTFPRGARASFCLPTDDAGAFDPAHPRCSADGDCAAGMICRRRSGDPYSLDAHGRCASEEPGLSAPGEHCAAGWLLPEGTGAPDSLAADASCQHGACENACLSVADVCHRARCTQPCRVNADCPERTVCQTFARPSATTPLEVRSCFLPLGGCDDELDCCPALDPDGSCLGGWDTLPTHCARLEQGGRLQTVCGGAPGPTAPGEPCATDDECASGLCLLPAPVWSAADPGMCAFICTTQLDRCPELTGAGAALCTPEPILVAGAQSSLTVCR